MPAHQTPLWTSWISMAYWEHCGMPHDPDYKSRWETKLKWYRAHDILPHEEGGRRQMDFDRNAR